MQKRILLFLLAVALYGNLKAMDRFSPEQRACLIKGGTLTDAEYKIWVTNNKSYIDQNCREALSVVNNLAMIIGTRKYNRLCRAWSVENIATVVRILDTAKGPFGYNLNGLKCEVEEDSVTTYVKHLELTLNRKDFAAFTFHPYLIKAERTSKSDKPKTIKKTGCKKEVF